MGSRDTMLKVGCVTTVKGTAVWNAADRTPAPASSGVYFFRLVVDGKVVQTKKMTLLK